MDFTLIIKHGFAMLQILSKMDENELIWFGNKCESASYKLHAASHNFTVICGSHIKGMPAFNLFSL